MKKKKKLFQVKLNLAVIFLIIIGSFFAGTIWQKGREENHASLEAPQEQQKTIRFSPPKSEKPTVELYLQSFEKNNQIIFKNLSKAQAFFEGKIDFTPHYIFTKTTQPEKPENCLETPETYFCAKESKEQLNENVREICAWNLTPEKNRWWNFVISVDKNCPPTEVDQCWQEEAKKYGLVVNQIQNCFSTQAVEILNSEINHLQSENINFTPTLLINDSQLPLNLKTDETKTVVKIGEKYFQPSQINTSDYYIAAVCSTFKDTPNICQ